jgi:thiol-disulfide isomerase/thioredoxin
MTHLTRRSVVAAGATVIAGVALRKPALGQDATAPSVALRPFSDIVRAVPPKTLPDLRFTTLDGSTRRLADYAGKPVVLNFWATWCIPCVAELPELDRLAETDPGVTVLAVSADRGGAAVVKPFVAAHGITHAGILLDPGKTGGFALGVFGFPTTLLIGPDGKLRGTLEGPAAWAGCQAAIAALMQG